MSHLFYLILFLVIFVCQPSFAQKKWDGEGGNTQWSDPLNWTGNTLPSPSDNIILDNSFVSGNYEVILPLIGVTVSSIKIIPSGDSKIELVLPKENTVVPALTVPGQGYGIIINKGGVFRNSSGASSGTPLIVSDSIKINDGGRFIVNTPRGHSANVERLSSAPGTEHGILEFDIPDASTTISLSGRIYGRLVLKSAAWGNMLNYTAAGTNKVVIRENLEIEDGVNLNLNFSDTIFVHGDFKQDRSILNIGTTSRNTVLAIAGNITQSPAGLITETGTGMQRILLNGSGEQGLNIQGQIANQVTFIKDGPGNAKLLSGLSLPYQLILKRGNITSSAAAMLMLQPGCAIIADSLSSMSYIDGPLRKMGLSNDDFLFPAGKRGQLRWIQLINATGDFIVEYFHENPYEVSGTLSAGIDHISTIEYWSIQGDNAATAGVKLSFNDPHSGGVTDITNLRVARLRNNKWENAGNTGFAGTPGLNGWVSSSNAAGGFSAGNNFFALASAISQENPLPISAIKFAIDRIGDKLSFNWETSVGDIAKSFELHESADNIRFKCIYACAAVPGKSNYRYEMTDTIRSRIKYYKVRSVSDDGSGEYFSKTLKIMTEQKQSYSMSTLFVRNNLNLRISLMENKKLDVLIYTTAGQAIKKFTMNVMKGTTTLKIAVTELTQGAYFLVILDGYSRLLTSKFVKGSSF